MFHKRFTMINFFLGFLLFMPGLMNSHANQDELVGGIRKVMMGHKGLIGNEAITRDDVNPSFGGISKLSGVAYCGGKSCRLLEEDKMNGGHGHKRVTGFVAFSDDYNGPKRHAPKHN